MDARSENSYPTASLRRNLEFKEQQACPTI